MAKHQVSWTPALEPQKAATYGNQGMIITSPTELHNLNVNYAVVFEGSKKYHIAIADIVNPYTLHVIIPEHDTAEEVAVKVYSYQEEKQHPILNLKFTYTSQIEHEIAKFLAQSTLDENDILDANWMVSLIKDNSSLWDRRLAKAFAQLYLPIEWTLVGDFSKNENKPKETLLHFAAQYGLKDFINVLLNLPGANQALSTCNISGLLPRDVARESGRIELVEILDAESKDNHRNGTLTSDTRKRKVKHNIEKGTATISNIKGQNIEEDISVLMELSKLNGKGALPLSRHSWPVNMHSKNEETYQNNHDENLFHLSDIQEEPHGLHSRADKEESGLTVDHEQKQDTSTLEDTKPQSPEIAFPVLEDKHHDDEVEPFIAPPSHTLAASPIPDASFSFAKDSELETRPTGRKGRPSTWYGGPQVLPFSENEEELRQSNSLEDFAKALADLSDDESLASASSESVLKDGLLQTASFSVENENRTESFVSSARDFSAGKDSDTENDHEDNCRDQSDGKVVKFTEVAVGSMMEPKDVKIDHVEDTGVDLEHRTYDDEHTLANDRVENGSKSDDLKMLVDVDDDIALEEEHEGIEMNDDCNAIQGENTAASNEEVNDQVNFPKSYHRELELNDAMEGFSAKINERDETTDERGNMQNASGRTEDDDFCNVNSKETEIESNTVTMNYENIDEKSWNEKNSYANDNPENTLNEHQKIDENQPDEEDGKISPVLVTGEKYFKDETKAFSTFNDVEEILPLKAGDGNRNELFDKESVRNENESDIDSFEITNVDEGKSSENQDDYEEKLALVGEDGLGNSSGDLFQKEELSLSNTQSSLNSQSDKGESLAEHEDQSRDQIVSAQNSFVYEDSSKSKETSAFSRVGKDVTEVFDDGWKLRPEGKDYSSDFVTSGKRDNELNVNDDDVGDDNEDKSELAEDVYGTKIKFENLKDVECEVKDFCLPGVNIDRNEQLFRVLATDDTESSNDLYTKKRIRFEDDCSSITDDDFSPICEDSSPIAEDSSSLSLSDSLTSSSFRQRSSPLLGVKTHVTRSGSNISVTSLQDVKSDDSATIRDENPTGVLNPSRKAKSYGDIRNLTESLMKEDENESENERKRINEDHAVLRRTKKSDLPSRYSSSDHLNQISHSRILNDIEAKETGQRRWSNFFIPKNSKTTKKPGRTPTFRRDTLRSSMISLGKGSKPAAKNVGESLTYVAQQSNLWAKPTSAGAMTNSSRQKSFTRDSPGTSRKSSTLNLLDQDEKKPDSPEEMDVASDDIIFDVDPDLENFDIEPEAWSVTVEKKVLKKMSRHEIKRQDVIMELIQTEKHHVRTLKIMQQVFYRGLSNLGSIPSDRLNELFPRINDLVEISSRFHRNLRCRQDENTVVQNIGDVIVKQFSGDNGNQMKQIYGEFVSKHPEAVALYKHYFKTDKKFSSFINKYQSHRVVRRLSIPECFTLVTQRMTKYPLLIEAILKATKSSNTDYKELQTALILVKNATTAIDNAIKDYEKQSQLKDIKARMEKGGVVLKNGVKLKNSRFVEYNSKMIHHGNLLWKNARGKLTETHVVLLESMVAFLLENDKKFSLLSIDGKSPCIALKTLMVREVATDKCSLYFVSTSKERPDMYEFVCSSQKEKKQWCQIINEAILKAPEDTGELFYSQEEEKRLAEERVKRRNDLLEIMKGKDNELSQLVDEKNKLVNDMKNLWPEGNGKVKENERITSIEKAKSFLLTVIHRTTQLTADSALIHESHSDSEIAAATYEKRINSPKRAETFGGFDRRPSQKSLRWETATIPEGKPEENNVQRRDSGLSLASESVMALNSLAQSQPEVGGSTSFQILDALQWILVQFSRQETVLETFRMEMQATTEEMKKVRLQKTENDKRHMLMKEEHQAELTRQKKDYEDLEKTFNNQVAELKLKLNSQQEKHNALLKNFEQLKGYLSNSK
ncbi:A-kinase anchor protein 13-like isoform X2 [Xenia sp. Carnegie-2017]|uniref:A-kinase anchor protein 13-like isoform X2 n=1 Tax=Xenia sp. Carnegie-2017 TaxID=2897299 RepID=UPI001F03E950|nr:A-kinase anchor protein 13-like isoform X2 [Xenia sp. Carnegie-2017]